MAEGWIKLHRRITENEIWFWERFTKAQAWIDLILLANYDPGSRLIRGIEVRVNRGQLTWSILSLADRWGWNERTVVRFLKMLEKKGMILTKSDNLTTYITIINYDLYQGNTEQSAVQDADQSRTKIQTYKRRNNNYKKERPIQNNGPDMLEHMKKCQKKEGLNKPENIPKDNNS